MSGIVNTLPKKQIVVFVCKKVVSLLIGVLVLTATVALLCTDHNASASSPVGQLGVEYSIYNLNIEGEALGIPFQREGVLLITHIPISIAGTQNGEIH
jgi:hypothetical protein